MNFGKYTAFAASACVASFFASTASASTVTVNYQGPGPFGDPNLSEIVKIASPGHNGRVYAGPFRLTGDNGFGDFIAFCVDLYDYMGQGHAYNLVTDHFLPPVVDDLDRLFTSAFGGVDTSVEGAAFQVAIWEIVNETETSYSLSSGAFRASHNAIVAAQANVYLDGLATAGMGGYDLTFLKHGTSQDLVTATPAAVPLPAAGLMLGLGLMGLGGLRRSRKA